MKKKIKELLKEEVDKLHILENSMKHKSKVTQEATTKIKIDGSSDDKDLITKITANAIEIQTITNAIVETITRVHTMTEILLLIDNKFSVKSIEGLSKIDTIPRRCKNVEFDLKEGTLTVDDSSEVYADNYVNNLLDSDIETLAKQLKNEL